jgi:mono/diheme cytochrome c family protein
MMTGRFSAIAILGVSFLTFLGCGPSKPATTDPQALYEFHCARCHARAGEPGGPSLGGSVGPDLSHVGSNKGITAEWIAAYVKNPKSVRPDARVMPAFEGEMTEEQIRSLAEHLAAKK